MNLAISNIAWADDEEPAIADLLSRLKVRKVEVAPGKIGKNPTGLGESEISAYRAFWESRDIRIVAMQSLLYGHPELTLFESQQARAKTIAYLKKIIDLGIGLGATAFVFGSPKLRRLGKLSLVDAEKVAAKFFCELGEYCDARKAVMCLEHNPPQYGCEFATTAKQAAEFVRKVDCNGFGLHLDAGGLILCNEPASVVEELAPLARHYHISQPNLAPLATSGNEELHAAYGKALKKAGYGHAVSIEMSLPADAKEPAEQRVTDAVAFARKYYQTQ